MRWEAKEAKKRGLSPRMRGNRAWTIRGNPWHGSIPTHAGKPRSDLPTPSQCRVYPHACGETFTIGLSRKALRGLSPRMRGNQLIGSVQGGRVGSIPTHAGKPEGRAFPHKLLRVYPHACGETRHPREMATVLRGLSPRMRGNLASDLSKAALPGSIPTHAGKPWRISVLGLLGRVYPHACGETQFKSYQGTREVGLSPRMRGNLFAQHDRCGDLGSIPTHAGKPVRPCPGRARRGVYPHACGETSQTI